MSLTARVSSKTIRLFNDRESSFAIASSFSLSSTGSRMLVVTVSIYDTALSGFFFDNITRYKRVQQNAIDIAFITWYIMNTNNCKTMHSTAKKGE